MQYQIKPSPIWEYGEIYKPRFFDNGDRTSYGHSAAWLTKTVFIDGEPVEVSCLISKPSKYKGARQFVGKGG